MRIKGLGTTARDVSEGKAAALRRGASNALAGLVDNVGALATSRDGAN